MKHLVYAILGAEDVSMRQLPDGLEGGPIRLFVEDGLAAAYSRVSANCLSPDRHRLLSYAHAIGELSELTTVLPMRYGCLLDTKAEIAELLTRRREVFRRALAEVAGCVEMGVRALPGKVEVEGNPAGNGHSPIPGVERSAGASYLARRIAHYARQDGQHEAANRIADGLKEALSGRFVQCQVEPAARPVSLYFLVRRECVAEFREAFQRVETACPERLLLTGPWPPYNFVGVGP